MQTCTYTHNSKKKDKLLNEKEKKKSKDSPTGNRTRVFRVTGGDTYHYTIEDFLVKGLH